MGNLFRVVLQTAILDDKAFREWRERPNLFLRGIALIFVVSLVAGLITFAVNLVNQVRSVDVDRIEEAIQRSFEQQFKYNPFWQEMDPEAREMMNEMMDVIAPMVTDIAQIRSPLPRGISGFFQAVGGWLSRGLTALGGWMFYGVLVLIAANLLGGGARLPDFLGMASLYVVPGLLGLLAPVPCLGGLLAFAGMIWSIVVYVKAVQVATDLDTGRSILAVFAPAIAIALLSVLASVLGILWLSIVLP